MKKGFVRMAGILMMTVLLFSMGGCNKDKIDLKDKTDWYLRFVDEEAEPKIHDDYITNPEDNDIVFKYKFDGELHFPKCDLYIKDKLFLPAKIVQKDIYDERRDTWNTSAEIRRKGLYRVQYEAAETIQGEKVMEAMTITIIIE